MTHAAVRPPRLAERLLASVLGGDEWSESILGDLHEEHAVRAARSRPRAAAWYWTHAVRLSTRGMAARTRAALSSPSLLAPPVTPPHPGDSLMRTLGLEVRHACRSILKRPAMSAIVVITLGLGLGANAAVFSMIDALVLRPFTMPDVDRITLLSFTKPDDIDRREALSPADYLDMKRQQPDAFERLAAFDWWNANLVGTGRTRERAGLLRLGRLLPGVRRAAGDGANLPSRRGDAGPAPAGDHRSRFVAAAVRVRPVDRRPGHRSGRGAIRGRRHRTAGLRLPDGFADLGAVVVQRRGGRQPPRPVSDRHRPPRPGPHARRSASADGHHRRAARARLPRHQHWTRATCLHHRRRHDGYRLGSDPVALAGVGGFRAAHRLCQRRQPAPGARRRAPARDGGPPRDRRQPRPRRARAAHRERSPGARRGARRRSPSRGSA